MATSEGKGSILLEFLIVVLAIVLIAVIIIPGKIWDQEKQEEKIAHDNIASIYETEKFYYRLNNKYTADPAELMRVVHQDSSLLQQQQVVNYTREFTRDVKEFLNIPLVKSIVTIHQNMNNIKEDLESNRRNFKPFENIFNEAEDLKMQLRQLSTSEKYPNFVAAAAYLDSLIDIQRNATDYTLQALGLRAKALTDSIVALLPNVDLNGLGQEWAPLSDRIAKFEKTVLRSELVKVTSVADRVRDFRKKVDQTFDNSKKIILDQNMQHAKEVNDKLTGLYQEFLKNFTVTSKHAMFRLSVADSLILHLTEDNFYSPVNHEMYKIIIDDDSSAVKVESPVLLKEIKEMASPIAQEIRELEPMAEVKAYLDSLEMIKSKAYAIRKKIRRNTDIFIKYKEVEEVIGQFNDVGFISAYHDLDHFMNLVDSTESFSEIKNASENALTGIRLWEQAYSENVFGKLDTVHNDLKKKLTEFNELLASIKRLPKGIENFEKDITMLDNALGTIKNNSNANTTDLMKKIEQQVEDLYLFAKKGKSIPAYVVFKKKIKNFGYIYRDSKSWEESKNK